MTDRIRAFTLEAGRIDLFISDCANCGVIRRPPQRRPATEEHDVAVLDVGEIHLHWGTLRALVNRGLVDTADWQHIALTEAGWPIATQAAEEVSR